MVVVTSFGKPVGETKTTPGDYYKLPFIQKTYYFKKNVKFHEMTSIASTKDNKHLQLKTLVQWQITDAIQYLKNIYGTEDTNKFISRNITSAQRQTINAMSLKELVGPKLKFTEFSELGIDYSHNIKIEKLAAESFSKIGLNLVAAKTFATYPINE